MPVNRVSFGLFLSVLVLNTHRSSYIRSSNVFYFERRVSSSIPEAMNDAGQSVSAASRALGSIFGAYYIAYHWKI